MRRVAVQDPIPAATRSRTRSLSPSQPGSPLNEGGNQLYQDATAGQGHKNLPQPNFRLRAIVVRHHEPFQVSVPFLVYTLSTNQILFILKNRSLIHERVYIYRTLLTAF